MKVVKQPANDVGVETKGWHVSVSLIFCTRRPASFSALSKLCSFNAFCYDQANTALVSTCEQYCEKVQQGFCGSVERAFIRGFFEPAPKSKPLQGLCKVCLCSQRLLYGTGIFNQPFPCLKTSYSSYAYIPLLMLNTIWKHFSKYC